MYNFLFCQILEYNIYNFFDTLNMLYERKKQKSYSLYIMNILAAKKNVQIL